MDKFRNMIVRLAQKHSSCDWASGQVDEWNAVGMPRRRTQIGNSWKVFFEMLGLAWPSPSFTIHGCECSPWLELAYSLVISLIGKWRKILKIIVTEPVTHDLYIEQKMGSFSKKYFFWPMYKSLPYSKFIREKFLGLYTTKWFLKFVFHIFILRDIFWNVIPKQIEGWLLLFRYNKVLINLDMKWN